MLTIDFSLIIEHLKSKKATPSARITNILRDDFTLHKLLLKCIDEQEVDVLYTLIMMSIEFDQSREYTHEQIQLRLHDRLAECICHSCEQGELAMCHIFHHQYKVRDSFAWSKGLTHAIRNKQHACIRFILEQHLCKATLEHYSEATYKCDALSLVLMHHADYSLVTLSHPNSMNLILHACHVNWTEGIDWLVRNGCPLTVKCTTYAAHLGQLECLQLLIDLHCPCSVETIRLCRERSKKATCVEESRRYKECEELLINARRNDLVVFEAEKCVCCLIA